VDLVDGRVMVFMDGKYLERCDFNNLDNFVWNHPTWYQYFETLVRNASVRDAWVQLQAKLNRRIEKCDFLSNGYGY
jgi:hypothetical protein